MKLFKTIFFITLISIYNLAFGELSNASFTRANNLCLSIEKELYKDMKETNKFYVRGGVHNHKMNSVTVTEESKLQTSKNSPAVHVGLGYHFNDKVRAEVTFNYVNHHYNNNWKNTNRCEMNLDKAAINSIMLGSYVNIINLKDFNLFVGGAVGKADIYETMNYQAILLNGSLFAKKSTLQKISNFSYSLTAGIDKAINDKLNFEISYSYKDFGKTKARNKLTDVKTSKDYNGHEISTSVRYKL